MLRDRRERLLGIEAAPQHERRGQRQREREVRVAPGVEQRRGDQRRLARPQRDPREQRRGRLERVGLLCATRPSACRSCPRSGSRPGRARAGGCKRRWSLARDQLLERRIARALARSPGSQPGDEALAARRRPRRTSSRELLVVDQRAGSSRAQHVGDLRPREGRVQIQHARAELRAGDRRLDEAAVVAAHDRDASPSPTPAAPQAVRERVGARVDLGEGQRAALVDDRQAVGVARSPRSL